MFSAILVHYIIFIRALKGLRIIEAIYCIIVYHNVSDIYNIDEYVGYYSATFTVYAHLWVIILTTVYVLFLI